ncbi:MBL fold metallo-hydrolase [Streptomyces sp. NPDC051001]|uniref:MBL fold metallo-hydrolase n=1 Tax=Streptomyces sp. NPDC051001 TaxID=3155795 RepID=UPI00344991B8
MTTCATWNTHFEDHPSGVYAIVFTSQWPEMYEQRPGSLFSPTTCTLVVGPTEAVLVDAQYLNEDIDQLTDVIADTGRRLTQIYVTHGHPDHYFGIGPLRRRFPQARAVALPSVVDDIRDGYNALSRKPWDAWFGDRIVQDPGPLPDVLEGTTLSVDGYELRAIEVGQSDIKPTSVVHVPVIDTVIAGDVIYNEIHQMLGLSGPGAWHEWSANVDRVAALNPIMIAAGHKKPDSDDRAVAQMIEGTRGYIADFHQAAHEATSATELIDVMLAKHGSRGNLWTLEFSAHSWFARRENQRPAP